VMRERWSVLGRLPLQANPMNFPELTVLNIVSRAPSMEDHRLTTSLMYDVCEEL